MKSNHFKAGYLLVIFIFIFSFSNAQVDTVFWFVAPEVENGHADRPIYFHVATLNQPSVVNISIPAAGITMVNNVTIAANSSQAFNVTAFINNLETPDANINQVLNKGVLITATNYITAYYEVLGTITASFGQRIVNTDIFALKGSNALGTEFYVPFQNLFANIRNTAWGPQSVESTIDIVATEDNTNITVYPTQPYRVGTGSSSAVINITLNRGQTYTIEARGNLGNQHLSGTRIVSDKKIAVTMKDDSIGEVNTAYDLAGDQIIPVDKIGSEYIVSGGYAFITATEDNTTISVAGVNQGVTLAKGQTHSLNLLSQTSAVLIRSSHPVYMNHLLKIDGEMGNAVMPPLKCTGSTTVTINRSSANFGEIFHLYITVRSGSENDFVVTNSLFPGGNTSIIQGSDFQPVAGTGGEWLFAKKSFDYNQLTQIPLGGNTITNTSGIFHLGIQNGKGLTNDPGRSAEENQPSGFRYGYFTDFGSLSISVNIPNQCVAEGDSVQIYPGKYQSYLWSTGSTDTAIYVKQSGNYTLTVAGQNLCSATTSFFVQIDKTPEYDLGPDINICEKKEITLTAAKNNFSQMENVIYSWNTGSADTTIKVTEAGMYIFTATNGCGQKTDTVFINKIDVRTNNLFTPNNDGKNETFELTGLKEIGDWELMVYNRWGQRVYRSESYDNRWDGFNEIDGVYFYYFKDKTNQCPEKKGWVHIVR